MKKRINVLGEKTGAQNIVKEIKQYQEKWLQQYQNKRYNINQKDEGTEDDRGRDGRTNFILRIKEQETRLILHEHDDDYNDDNDDDDDGFLLC